MIAHLEVIRDLLGTTVPVDLWTPEPGRLPPFLVIEAPSWAPDPSMAVDGVPHMIETDVRLRAVAGTPAGGGSCSGRPGKRSATAPPARSSSLAGT